MTSCDWNDPGAHRYTGTGAAAIMAMATIPLDVRQRLAARPLDSFDDFIYIDRTSIRSAAREYDPSIRSMHFGSAGRVCDTVTRDSWDAKHVETALVFCDGEWCVAAPTICSNWFLLSRRPEATRANVPDGPAGPEEAAATPLAGYPPTYAGPWVPVPVVPAAEGFDTPTYFSGGGPGYGFPGGGGYGGGPSCCYCPPEGLTPPIPEPSTWALLLAGLAAVGATRRARPAASKETRP